MHNSNPTDQYRIKFLAGTSGRFISTILYGLLVDPDLYIDYTHNSAHEFQISNNLFYSLGTINWHIYPTEWDEMVKYIIIQIDRSTILNELAHNNLTKNLLWAIDLLVQEPDKSKYFPESLEILLDRLKTYYLEATGKEYLYSSLSELTELEIKKLSWNMLKTVVNDHDYSNYKTTPYPESLFFQPLVIKYSEIYQPQGSSWRVLDQLCEYTETSASSQVLDNYSRYVAQRNASLKSIPRLPPQLG